MYPILCGVESAYVENNNEVFLENARMYYAKLEIVEDLMDILDKDKICKLAVFDEVDAYGWGTFGDIFDFGTG